MSRDKRERPEASKAPVSLWRRLLARLTTRRRPATRDRFSHFLAIGSANDRFLSRLAQMMEVASGPHPLGRDAAQAGFRALSTVLQAMVGSLQGMAPDGRYLPLAARLEALEQEVGREIVPGRTLDDLPLVVRLGDPDAVRAEVVGGKAANLAQVAALPDVVTPPFFVLTTRAYQIFLAAMGSQKRINELFWTRDRTDARGLRAACDEIRRGILMTEVPEVLETALHSAYRELHATHRSHLGVAARSSALCEDAEVSFAGQFQSVLGVQEGGLSAAYRHVVAGKYRYEAVHYARMAGFLDEEVAMPVLFMGMVQPVASGVAYSRDPENGDDVVVVSAVRGLAVAMVDGSVTADRFLCDRALPNAVKSQTITAKTRVLRCAEEGGIIEVPVIGEAQLAPALRPELARSIAQLAVRLEAHLGQPQDIEWAVDEAGVIYVIQARPLRVRSEDAGEISRPAVEGRPLLASGGARACGGAACGVVFQIADPESDADLDRVPAGAVIVVPTTSPRLSATVERVAAIVTEAGSPTGHMATVAREFRVPTLVGVEGACALLPEGETVTVDAWSGRIYQGEVREVLAERGGNEVATRDLAKLGLRRLLDRVAPLTLAAPGDPEFAIDRCMTLHDVARFVHQKSMAEMFSTEQLTARDRREAVRLRWTVPMDLLVLDLGGGLSPGSHGAIELAAVESIPFRALIEGMTDPALRWSGPVGFDLKGFMSVVVRSAADDQRYGEPSFTLCSREYMHFSSRLAYHFATTDAMCSATENQNYARFVFFGGAAVAARREWRAHFLATVLKAHGFGVNRVGDRVEAMLGKLSQSAIRTALVRVGQLMVAARHLDMVIDSVSTADAYAGAFLRGDLAFEFARKGL